MNHECNKQNNNCRTVKLKSAQIDGTKMPPSAAPPPISTGAELSDSCLYEKLIHCALNQETSNLRVSPTILGERHDPLCLGHVTGISTSNLSLGHVIRALCHGVLDNVTSMMPVEHLQQAGVRRIVGSGSALARNEVLRQEVEKAFPLQVVYGQNADSALGVAMILCDRL